MADPLSFTASLIAIGTLAVHVSKLVKHALHASDEVLVLEDELEDVKALTKQLETLCQEQWPVEHQATVDEAKHILDDVIKKRLQNLQDYFAKHFRGTKVKVKKNITWAVLRRKINVEREGLRSGKKRLLNIFHILNSSSTRHLSFQATKISLDVEHIQDSQDRSYQDIVARLKQCLGPIDNIQASSKQVAEIMQLMQRVQIGVDELNGKLAQGSDDARKRPNPEPAHNIPKAKPTALTTPSPDWQQAYQLVSCVLEGRESKCALWCTCACHSSRKHLSLPTNLERLTGQLLIGFSVHPWLRPRCNLQSCKRSSEARVRLRYRFPAWWFLAYSVTLQAQTKDLGIVLRFPQVRSCDADVFEMVAHGRLDAIKSAFASKAASIYDTEDTGGHTLLHRALITKNVDMIEFLLKQGADTLAVNQKKNSSADIFWRSVLSNGLPEAAYGRLAAHFTDTTFIEDGGYTIIHKIIFGQSKSNLDQMLRDLPHLVNQQDAYGLAPLHWAATRGDVQSISTLLEHHAEVDIVERGGSTPLIWGIDSANPDVTRRLLKAGADPDHASNIWLDRAIHIACHEERFHCQVPVLLEYGVDASASSRLRDSPLEFAASRDFAVTVEALFKATAPLKHTKAVIAAVKNNALQSLRKLMELGADCLGVDASGKTVLHHAALHGIDPTIRLLALYKRKLPRQTADNNGRFPIDYAAERSASELSRTVVESLFEIEEEELVELEEVIRQEARDEDEDEDESEIEFEDAVQELVAL
ncbi:ankyrin [Lophium mytilinum]|uniref:Ankyrin n=1 Tax=Lophium mytilinum TaxID=390894 RepID=A0A6A6QM49_9PEZI|nr:ankyrin [Lophium mytilinum]